MSTLSEVALPPAQTRYSFITLLDPVDSSLPSQRKAVRSHAALYQHSQEKNTRLCRRPKNKRLRKPESVVFAVLEESNPFPFPQNYLSETNEVSSRGRLNDLIPRFTSSPNLSVLGQGRVDPFRTYPVPWEPFLPELVDHCSYIVPIP